MKKLLLSPHLKSLSPHVVNGDKVGHLGIQSFTGTSFFQVYSAIEEVIQKHSNLLEIHETFLT